MQDSGGKDTGEIAVKKMPLEFDYFLIDSKLKQCIDFYTSSQMIHSKRKKHIFFGWFHLTIIQFGAYFGSWLGRFKRWRKYYTYDNPIQIQHMVKEERRKKGAALFLLFPFIKTGHRRNASAGCPPKIPPTLDLVRVTFSIKRGHPGVGGISQKRQKAA